MNDPTTTRAVVAGERPVEVNPDAYDVNWGLALAVVLMAAVVIWISGQLIRAFRAAAPALIVAAITVIALLILAGGSIGFER